MGGVIFIISIAAALIITLAWSPGSLMDIGLILLMSLVFGAIGFVDDFIKVVKKRNLGLTRRRSSAAIFGGSCFCNGGCPLRQRGNCYRIPFSQTEVDLGWLYIPFVIFVMLATVNSVNLTDGLDGLATTVTMVVALFYLLVSLRVDNNAVALFAAVLLGALAGFLFYNWKPAKVFMGDTGSLFLGGAVCGMAVMLKQPITLLIVGFVYVMETLSVIMQVTSYKMTGKRIFKMSPIHHHFEMCGWGEVKIVCVFSLVTLILCAIMYFFG